MMERQPAAEHAPVQPPLKRRRFLNMQPEQAQRREERHKKRRYRAQAEHVASESSPGKQTPKKPRPCCGHLKENCTCKPPSGMKEEQLTSLANRFAETALCSVRDTTDVSAWRTHMQHATEQLPLRVLLAHAHTHVIFNQEPLLKAFIDHKAFLFKAPWFDWQMLQGIVKKTQGHRQHMPILQLQKYHIEKACATEPPGHTTTKTYECCGTRCARLSDRRRRCHACRNM